jgi:hypothetical protein
LETAGLNGDGEFIVRSKDGHVVRIPNEWAVPLAAHLLAPFGIFDPRATRVLRDLEQRGRKKRGGKVEEKDAEALAALAERLEHLMQHYLEADPKTSRREEWRAAYPAPRVRPEREAEDNLGTPVEEMDDTPAPWEVRT